MLPANIELVDSISLKSGRLWVRFFICTFVTSFSDVFLDPNCLIVIPSPAGYVFESLSSAYCFMNRPNLDLDESKHERLKVIPSGISSCQIATYTN